MSVHDPAIKLRPVNVTQSTRQYLAAMWKRRDFALAMPVEELRVSHQNTLLGKLWHLGDPLLTTAVYYLIFVVILNTDRGVENPVAWIAIGVFGFSLTTRSVIGGANSMLRNQGLIRSIRFPRALLPVSIVISRLMTFGFELLVIVAVVLVTGEGVSLKWLALPAVLTVHTALNLGGAFVAARLNEAYRDVQQIIPFMFRLLRYVSGVMFPIERFISRGDNDLGWLRVLAEYNPLYAMLNLYRWVFLDWPVTGRDVAVLTGIALLVLVIGFGYFRAAEWRYGRN